MRVKNLDKFKKFSYKPYVNKLDKEIPIPENTLYKVGDVVYLKHTQRVGVVIGVIDNEGQELRTDVDGMVAFSDLRLATTLDFVGQPKEYIEKIKKEIA